MYVKEFIPLEPKRLGRSGRTNYRSMRWNGRKTMARVWDRLVAHGTCHVRSRKPLQNISSLGCRPKQLTDSTQTLWTDSHHGLAQLFLVSDGGAPFTRVGGTRIVISLFRSLRTKGGSDWGGKDSDRRRKYCLVDHREFVGSNPARRILRKRDKSAILTQDIAICNASL